MIYGANVKVVNTIPGASPMHLKYAFFMGTLKAFVKHSAEREPEFNGRPEGHAQSQDPEMIR